MKQDTVLQGLSDYAAIFFVCSYRQFPKYRPLALPAYNNELRDGRTPSTPDLDPLAKHLNQQPLQHFAFVLFPSQTACAIVAGLLHYFFLSAFCWMLLEGVELYLMVVQVFKTHALKHWHLFLVGYGLPAIVVGISASVYSEGYGTNKQ